MINANAPFGTPTKRPRCREVPPLDQLHGIERVPLMPPDLVDRHDVRMVETHNRLGLNQESADLRLGGELPGEDHLQRHHPIQADLPRLVNDPHPTAGNLFDEHVVADLPGGAEFVIQVSPGRLGRSRRLTHAAQVAERLRDEVQIIGEPTVIIARGRLFADRGATPAPVPGVRAGEGSGSVPSQRP